MVSHNRPGRAAKAQMPMQAALASAGTFAIGAALPLGVSLAALLFLMLLGALGARAGGAPISKGMLRVTFWGVIAMAATYGIGWLLGTSVA